MQTVDFLKWNNNVLKCELLRRITIMLDENLIKIIRQKQAHLIKKSNTSISFSAVIRQTLRDSLKK